MATGHGSLLPRETSENKSGRPAGPKASAPANLPRTNAVLVASRAREGFARVPPKRKGCDILLKLKLTEAAPLTPYPLLGIGVIPKFNRSDLKFTSPALKTLV
jgi:hypothetical protein